MKSQKLICSLWRQGKFIKRIWLYLCPYALTGLDSQGWATRSLWLMLNDHQHHLWHGTVLAFPRMHHCIFRERGKAPCNYLGKPGSSYVSMEALQSMLSGLCLNTLTHTTPRVSKSVREVQSRSAALTALQQHWLPFCGLTGISLGAVPRQVWCQLQCEPKSHFLGTPGPCSRVNTFPGWAMLCSGPRINTLLLAIKFYCSL